MRAISIILQFDTANEMKTESVTIYRALIIVTQ